jgi:glycosyltransferase involved in cell wall biosynthesis
MRVLMLTPDAQMIDRRILQEARTLVRAGHEVTLLAGFECARAEECEVDGIRICRCQYDWDDERLKKIRPFVAKNELLTRLVNRVFMFLARRFFSISPFDRYIIGQGLRFPSDVVHVHDFPALQAGVVLARTWGVPLVYDAHEIYYAQDVLPLRIRKAYFRKERRLIRHAQAVITVNEFIADLMQQRHRIGAVHVLYNCADPDPGFDPIRERAASPLRAIVNGPGPVLLYQGWLSAERNLDTLVKAMAHVPPPAQLAVIGYGDCIGHLQQLARDTGVEGRVHFLGKIPSEQMLRYTVGADLGLIPYLPIDENHRYCSPNKFFEYVQTEVPVLAHELPFFRQMADRYGVVTCADFTFAEQVGRAVTVLLCDETREKMRQRCRKARAILNWSEVGKKLLGLYERLARPKLRKSA